MKKQPDNSSANNEDSDKLLTFPTRFPVKIMGRADADFHKTIMAIVNEYVDAAHNPEVHERNSGKGNFISITVTFDAQSQQQLDDLYQALSDHDKVLMAL